MKWQKAVVASCGRRENGNDETFTTFLEIPPSFLHRNVIFHIDRIFVGIENSKPDETILWGTRSKSNRIFPKNGEHLCNHTRVVRQMLRSFSFWFSLNKRCRRIIYHSGGVSLEKKGEEKGWKRKIEMEKPEKFGVIYFQHSNMAEPARRSENYSKPGCGDLMMHSRQTPKSGAPKSSGSMGSTSRISTTSKLFQHRGTNKNRHYGCFKIHYQFYRIPEVTLLIIELRFSISSKKKFSWLYFVYRVTPHRGGEMISKLALIHS